MPFRVRFAILLVGLSAAAQTPPAISKQGAVNKATRRPAAAGGAIAPGSLVSINGVGFATDAPGNSVHLKTAAGTVDLPVVSAAARRLDVWIPLSAHAGAAELTVTSRGQASGSVPVILAPAALGFFATNDHGFGPAQAVNISQTGTRSRNDPAHAAEPGMSIVFSANGLAGRSIPEIFIAGIPAKVSSVRPATAASGYTGDLTVQLPVTTPEGCFIPVYGRWPGGRMSNTVTIAVRRGGAACERSPRDFLTGWKGGNTAVFMASRTRERPSHSKADHVRDELTAGFFAVKESSIFDSPFLMPPPEGACTTFASTLEPGTPAAASVTELILRDMSGTALAAAESLTIGRESVAGVMHVTSEPGAPGLFRRLLSGGIPMPQRRLEFSLDSGILHVQGLAGRQVGAFDVTLPAPAHLEAASPDRLDRTKPFSVSWKTSDTAGAIGLVLTSSDLASGAVGATYCTASAAAGRFSVPATMLQHLPDGDARLLLVAWPPPSSGTAIRGIDRVLALSIPVLSVELAQQ